MSGSADSVRGGIDLGRPCGARPVHAAFDMSKTRLDFRRLTVAERIQLAEDLWDSVAGSEEVLQLTDAQRAELARRLEAHRDDPSGAIPWEVFRKELLEG